MDTQNDALLRVNRIVLQRLESLVRAGVDQIGKPLQSLPPLSITAPPPEPYSPEHAPPTAERGTMSKASSPRGADKPENKLAVLQKEVAACTRCSELAATRTQTVFGVGDPKARLCFFGEAPGADEDRLGEPFVGRAGRLLTDIIQKGMGIRREDVYILNVLKCRPPNNRNPEPEEVANCRGYFERQLELIQPEFICCLGAVAAKALLESTQSVGRMRGYFHEYGGIKVLVTYHPSYLLRNPAAKKETWKDIQLLMNEMGLTSPKKSAP